MIPNALAAPGWATRADFDRLVRDLERLGTLLTIENFQAWIATHPRVPDPVAERPPRIYVRRPLKYPERPTVIPPYEGQRLLSGPDQRLPLGGHPRLTARVPLSRAVLLEAFEATTTAATMCAHLHIPDGSLQLYLREAHLGTSYTRLKAARRPAIE